MGRRSIAVGLVFLTQLIARSGAALLLGDVNHDARVSASDVSALQAIVAGLLPGSLEADVNQDGFVLEDDLRLTIVRIFDRATAPTATPSRSFTAVRSVTPSPTATRSPTQTATLPAPTATFTAVATLHPSATETAEPTVTVTATASPTGTRTSTASPTATFSPAPSPTASVSPTAALQTREYCDDLSLPLVIPDAQLPGLTRTIQISEAATISDLDVRLDVSHSWVGDLIATLTHVESGLSVVLLDRPGEPGAANGCGGDDVFATFDADAGRLAETTCAARSPALGGSLRPLGDLSQLSGRSIAGTWRLNIVDAVTQDAGSLFNWCLQLNSAAPVVTSFTCNGAERCTVPLGQSFALAFAFRDRDGNAVQWRMTQVRDDGVPLGQIAGGTFDPPLGAAQVTVPFTPFLCSGGNCRAAEFDYLLTVIDSAGQESPVTLLSVAVPAG